MIQLAVTPALSSCVVGGLTSQVCNVDSVLPQKTFQDKKLQEIPHSSEKRTFPWDKATRNHSNNKAHALWHSLMSVSLNSITNTGQNDFITMSLLWSNIVKCSTPSSADCFHTGLRGNRSVKAATTAHVTIRDIGRLLWGEPFIFLYINTLFSTLKELLRTDMDSQIAADMVLSPDSLSNLYCLYASKHLLPNSPQWTNCS